MSIYKTGPTQGKIIEFGLESDLSNGLIVKPYFQYKGCVMKKFLLTFTILSSLAAASCAFGAGCPCPKTGGKCGCGSTSSGK